MLHHTRVIAANQCLVRATRQVRCIAPTKVRMWILVQVARGSKHYEAESRVGNHVLISDTSDMVISGRSLGSDGYRFEARKGNESFVVSEFQSVHVGASLTAMFLALADRMGAISLITPATQA